MANEWIKDTTAQIVRYLETTKDERLQHKLKRKAAREPWQSRWFGMVPMGIGIWRARRKNNDK